MRYSIAVAVNLVLASAAVAIGQETPPTTTTPPPAVSEPAPAAAKPDFSRDALLRFVATASEEHPPVPRRVQWGFGTVEFPLFGTRFRLAWLPFLPTLNPIGRYGSINPTIDPFEMTAVGLPMRPRDSAERRELRRIERRLRRDSKQN